MDTLISKLAECFEKLPGIGPRQARRFVYSLLQKDTSFIIEFSKLITDLKKNVIKCKNCNHYFQNSTQTNTCSICSDLKRDKTKLLIIEKNIDLENIEKAKSYNGFYFVLGGLIPSIGSKISKETK
ncbi:unnamed protein product, partial [marine sediment metagenome]